MHRGLIHVLQTEKTPLPFLNEFPSHRFGFHAIASENSGRPESGEALRSEPRATSQVIWPNRPVRTPSQSRFWEAGERGVDRNFDPSFGRAP